MVVGEALGVDIGVALLRGGERVPGTEYGHLEFKGGPAEHDAASGGGRDTHHG